MAVSLNVRHRLPLELTNTIIDFLHDSKPTLKVTALVCRDWLPESRYHLFRQLHLNQYPNYSVEPFLELCKSPLVTFQPAVKYFGVTLRNFRDDGLDKLLRWRDSKSQRTLDTILPRVTVLTLANVGLSTLGNLSLRNLLSSRGYWKNTLTQLSLYVVEFQSVSELLVLVRALPLLQLLALNRPALRSSRLIPRRRGYYEPLPPNLREIILENVHSSLIRALGSCTTVSILRCYFYGYPIGFRDRMPAIRKILRSAGLALKEFTFATSSPVSRSSNQNLDSSFKHFDILSQNKNLERLNLCIRGQRFLIPFLTHLSTQFNPAVHHPSLESLEIKFLNEFILDWRELDSVLQSPYFSSLRELKYTVKVYNPNHDQGPDGPAEGSETWLTMQNKVEMSTQRLPRCARRKILYPQRLYCTPWRF